MGELVEDFGRGEVSGSGVQGAGVSGSEFKGVRVLRLLAHFLDGVA